MAVGDREAAFCEAAAEDGVRLVKGSVPYVNQRGHFGLPGQSPAWARDALQHILIALDGDPAELSGGRSTPLPGDFVHVGTGRLVEFDEMQHFTSWRSRSLEPYPEQALLGFQLESYLRVASQPRCK